MNRELKRVTIVALLMFLTLFVSSTIIQYVQADALAADPRNARTLYESYSVERGPILVDGDADRVLGAGRRRLQVPARLRERPAVRAGHRLLPRERRGHRARAVAQRLPQRHSRPSQFLDQLNRLISGQDPMGASVEVTIDPVAQQAAWDALGDYTGAVVATEPDDRRASSRW